MNRPVPPKGGTLREYADFAQLWEAIDMATDAIDMGPDAVTPVFARAVARLAREIAVREGPTAPYHMRASGFTVGLLMGVAIGRRSDILVFKAERTCGLAAAAEKHG